ncbi:SEC62, partial [Symbiodinium natans]
MFRRNKNEKEPEWDPTFEPLMKVLLGKKGIKTKTASEVGRKKVDYFRGKDFKKFLLESEGILTKKCSKALEEALDGQVPQTDPDVVRLGQELIDRKFCYKAMYKPLNPSSKSDDGDKKPKKWPDRLGRTPNQAFDSEGFYVITYEGGSGLQHFLLALIIAGVLLACMFPVWPMWAKVGVWYLSVIFLTLYFGVLILRMLIFTMFWIVGFDFWIFPNLNDEYCGFLDSFQPLYSWEKRKDDALMLLVRFGSLGIAAVAIQQIAETTSFEDVQDLVTSSYADVLAWGVDKLTALPGSEKQALPSVEELQKEKDLEENETNVTADLADDDDDKDEGSAPGAEASEVQEGEAKEEDENKTCKVLDTAAAAKASQEGKAEAAVQNSEYSSYSEEPTGPKKAGAGPRLDKDEVQHFEWRVGLQMNSRYVVSKFLGDGTFGRVLQAKDCKRNRQVAIKIIRNVEKYTRNAMREAEILQALGMSLYDLLKQNHYRGLWVQDFASARKKESGISTFPMPGVLAVAVLVIAAPGKWVCGSLKEAPLMFTEGR